MGASGDLAPLSHLALGLMGEGKMWSPKSGWADAKYVRSLYSNVAPLCLRSLMIIYLLFTAILLSLTFALPTGFGSTWAKAYITETKRGTTLIISVRL